MKNTLGKEEMEDGTHNGVMVTFVNLEPPRKSQ